MNKNLLRKRRSKRSRMKMRQLDVVRLCVNRTSQHIYAQLIKAEPNGDRVLASASTVEKEIKVAGGTKGNIHSATVVGEFIGQRGVKAGIDKVAFDRSGFKYHGCIRALADAARSAGLLF